MAQREPVRKSNGSSASGGAASGGSGSISTRQEIPDKLYFRIGEVAKLCGVASHVLRFWEGEFPPLRPNKGGTGQRLFRRRDVEMALRIKSLLYDEGYTIPGARQAIRTELRAPKEPQLALGIAGPGSAPVDVRHLQAIRKELGELHAMLSRPATQRSGVQPIRAPRPVPAAAPKREPKQFPKPALIPDAFDSLFDQLVEAEPTSGEPDR